MPSGRPLSQYSRLHYRVSVHYPVIVVAGPMTGIGLLINLSIHGCAIEYDGTMTPGLHVKLRLQLPQQRHTLSIETAAVRWTCGSRNGLEFLTMTSEGQQHLYRCVIDELTHTVQSMHDPSDH